MKRSGQIILIILFLSIIFTMPVLTKLAKYEAVSQFENRTLAKAPVATIASIFSGEYFSKWETYLADHIYGRNNWISGYTYLNAMVLGRSRINEIVVGKNGYLLPFFDYDGKYDAINSDDNLNKMAEQLRELQDRLAKDGGRFYFVGVPSQASYHRDDYPAHLLNNSLMFDRIERQLFTRLDEINVPYINMNKVFRSEANTEYYYKTDHHYNFEGAYKTYYEIMKRIYEDSGYQISKPMEKDELNIVTLPNPFGGSRNKQVYYMFPANEHIKIAYPKNQVAFEKYNNGKADPKLYYLKKDESSMINYGVNMGGDWAETVIKAHNDKLPNLLIFGDSFTNAIEPLLFNHFNETRILDLRYYNKMSLYEYIDEYKPDIVLMVRDDMNYGSFEGNGSFKGENVKRK